MCCLKFLVNEKTVNSIQKSHSKSLTRATPASAEIMFIYSSQQKRFGIQLFH